MTELLKLRSVSFEIQDESIFDNINATVKQGEVIGLIGRNGAGKSTLLDFIHGTREASNGQIEHQGITVEYVVQEKEEVDIHEVTALEADLLAKWSVPEHNYHQLSGGERLKLRLAKGFASRAQLLLLDEPTNHLDQQSTELLIEQIKSWSGTIIVVSHDRYFLDAVATTIWSLEGKELFEHSGNYSSYTAARRETRKAQQRAYEKQQKKVDRIEKQMKELTSWSDKAHKQSTKQEGYKEYYRLKAKRMDAQVKSKRKRLERELAKEKVERVENDHTVQFSIQAGKRLGRRFLEVKELKKVFGERVLFQDVHFTVIHGEKLALIGPNGSGKTTLLNIFLKREPVQGEVWISPSCEIGYLTQEVFDLPLEQTPAQLFHQETFDARGKVQSLMKHLGFMASHWKQPIANMSMGERVKLKLMMYILEEKDALILDEPTNHLDLPSREQLESTLAHYNGTMLIVSHDQYFLNKLMTGKLLFTNGTIEKHAKEEIEKMDDTAELRLKLETERQEVLGRLSLLKPQDKDYAELDKRFNELTKAIKELL